MYSDTILEMGKIILTAVLTTVLTYLVTKRSEINKIKRSAYIEILNLVYAPIIAVIENGIDVDIGYEGLTPEQVADIFKIVNRNKIITDSKLNNYVWSFREEMEWIDDPHYRVDRFGAFSNYVYSEFNRLRRKAYLPFDKQYVFPWSLLQRIRVWLRRCRRRIRRQDASN